MCNASQREIRHDPQTAWLIAKTAGNAIDVIAAHSRGSLIIYNTARDSDNVVIRSGNFPTN